MKRISVLLLAVVFTLSGALSANAMENEKKPVKNQMSKEISEMLKAPSLDINGDVKAEVTFTLNEDNEIVVLKVKTENADVERFIKQRLNYKKIKFRGKLPEYKLTVRVTT